MILNDVLGKNLENIDECNSDNPFQHVLTVEGLQQGIAQTEGSNEHFSLHVDLKGPLWDERGQTTTDGCVLLKFGDDHKHINLL